MNIKLVDFVVDDSNYGRELILFSMLMFLSKTCHCNVEIYDTRSIFNTSRDNDVFWDFEQKFMTFKKITSIADVKRDSKSTDLFIFPGDQIWNFKIRPQPFFKQFFTLPFIEKSRKLAYSVSDGGHFTHISKQSGAAALNGALDFLKDIEYLSVREEKTHELLLENGIQSAVNIDSVFLTDIDDWKSLAKKPANVSDTDAFDFYYIIGRKPVEAVDKSVKNVIAYANNRENRSVYTPEEFLWLCLNCRSIHTNSFHGFCFSVMFNKDVAVYDVGNYRISSIAKTLGISFGSSGKAMYDYNKVLEKIKECKEKGRSFIESALKSIENSRTSLLPKRYAAYSNSSLIRDLSTSGGICAELARHVLSKHNSVVYGVRYAEDFRSVKYDKVDNIADYFKHLSKSKYSDPDFSIKKDAVKDIKSGKTVLFIGCPCHILELKKELAEDYSNFFSVGLVCHGCSLPHVLHDFIDEITPAGCSVKKLDMRLDHGLVTYAEFTDGHAYQKKITLKKFVDEKQMAERCGTCTYHRGNNVSDIVVGDFWAYGKFKGRVSSQFDVKKGTNILTVNTGKGKTLLNAISDNIECVQLDSVTESVPDMNLQYDVIVSFATYKLRIEKDELYQSMDSIVNQKFNGRFHVVANLWKPDYDSAPQKLKDYFAEHGIEVILTDKDYKTHNKYCFVFEKYKGIPVATFDDDQIYRQDALQLMFDTHKRHPRTLIGGFCVIPGGIVDKMTGRRGKPRPRTGTPPGRGIQLWGSGGNFYPPEFTEKITAKMVERWIQNSADSCKYDNDMYLFRMAKKFGFNGMVVECNHKKATWRGYLVERFLPTADDETAKTWKACSK